MAPQDPSHIDRIDRARRVARRVLERHELTPPVDVLSVLSEYAEVETASIPADCDALVIGLNRPTLRPRVIVNDDKPPRRKRFSIAHELGHILIPGHISIEVCFMEAGFYDSSSADEREAHAFASEVLMPTAWLAGLVESAGTLSEVFAAAEVADVSAAAGVLAVNRVLPSGYVLVLANAGTVEMALASPGTVAHLPARGEQLDVSTTSAFAAAHGRVLFSGRRIMWWQFDAEIQLPNTEGDDARSASDLLREIVGDCYPDDPSARQRAVARVNGVAGWAKGGFDEAAGSAEMMARLQARFANRAELADVVRHPQFRAYLAKKARELTAKQTG